MADREDPDRKRFSDDTKKIVQSAEAKVVQEVRTSTLDFKEVIRRAKEILELDNPAEVNYKLNTLALQAGYRDQTALEKLIVDQISLRKGSRTSMSRRRIDGDWKLSVITLSLMSCLTLLSS
jgi:hypothetical protein